MLAKIFFYDNWSYNKNCMMIKVKVWAGAGKEKVIVKDDSRLEVFVKEPALSGLANRRVLELVVKHFEPKFNKAVIVSGAKTPFKTIKLLGQKEA